MPRYDQRKGQHMVQVQIRVCDVCGDPKRITRPYRLGQAAREAAVDLCDEDAVPFEALLPKRAGRKPGTRSSQHFRLGVTTVEAIEASKGEAPPANGESAPPPRTRRRGGAQPSDESAVDREG